MKNPPIDGLTEPRLGFLIIKVPQGGPRRFDEWLSREGSTVVQDLLTGFVVDATKPIFVSPLQAELNFQIKVEASTPDL